MNVGAGALLGQQQMVDPAREFEQRLDRQLRQRVRGKLAKVPHACGVLLQLLQGPGQALDVVVGRMASLQLEATAGGRMSRKKRQAGGCASIVHQAADVAVDVERGEVVHEHGRMTKEAGSVADGSAPDIASPLIRVP
ncbi:hypothetical protein [Roseateles aquatilis]|uniref:hypothetical protein n=1 Tax=Roseateles aquatilis TaxID=431061 RepID=UPI0011325335|nr:hypothetical protein [Roseateles aquatilis]